MTLAELDKAFKDMWKHPNQLPALLEKWQEMVSECLSNTTHSATFKAEFESYLAQWQTTLTKNRDLLLQEQQKQKEKLSIGTMKVDPNILAKKFNLDKK